MIPMLFEKQRSWAVISLTALLLAACAGLDTAPPASPPSSPSAPAPARPVPPPASLIGVGPETVRAALGNPAFKRAETGTEIWQYGAGQCRLFVYFYDIEGKTGADPALTSAHIDARRAAGGASDVGACLSEIVQAPPSPGR